MSITFIKIYNYIGNDIPVYTKRKIKLERFELIYFICIFVAEIILLCNIVGIKFVTPIAL